MRSFGSASNQGFNLPHRTNRSRYWRPPSPRRPQAKALASGDAVPALLDKLQGKSHIWPRCLSTARAGLAQPDIPLDAVLSFLKDTRGVVNWSAKDLKHCLKLDAKQAQQLLAILEMQGYVAPEGDRWLTTAAGEGVSRSKNPQFSLHSVTKAVDVLRDRIAAVNRDKRSEFKITKAVVFGDFLSGRPQVQAAEFGVELSGRDLLAGHPDERERKRDEFMDSLRRKSRLVRVQAYRPWMSQRTHLKLL